MPAERHAPTVYALPPGAAELRLVFLLAAQDRLLSGHIAPTVGREEIPYRCWHRMLAGNGDEATQHHIVQVGGGEGHGRILSSPGHWTLPPVFILACPHVQRL